MAKAPRQSQPRSSGHRRPSSGLIAAVVLAAAITGIVVFAVATQHAPEAQPASKSKRTPTFVLPKRQSGHSVDSAGQPATAQFTFHRTRPGYKNNFYVLGEVKNTSPFPIRKPEIVVVMLDAAGKEVGTDNGYASKDYLAPGEKSYVAALVSNPVAHKSLRFEVVPRRATHKPEQANGLRAIDTLNTRRSTGGYRFTGKVENRGDKPAKFVSVKVYALDSEDKLLGHSTTFAKTDLLLPGTSARYQVDSARYEQEPARFQINVSGMAAK